MSLYRYKTLAKVEFVLLKMHSNQNISVLCYVSLPTIRHADEDMSAVLVPQCSSDHQYSLEYKYKIRCLKQGGIKGEENQRGYLLLYPLVWRDPRPVSRISLNQLHRTAVKKSVSRELIKLCYFILTMFLIVDHPNDEVRITERGRFSFWWG